MCPYRVQIVMYILSVTLIMNKHKGKHGYSVKTWNYVLFK